MILVGLSRIRHNILSYKIVIHKPTIINAIPENIFIFNMADDDKRYFFIFPRVPASIKFPTMGTNADRQQINNISKKLIVLKSKKLAKSVI